MINIKKNTVGEKSELKLAGRLDTTTAPQLEADIKSLPDSISVLVLDLNGLEYLSSAGLRVILAAQKMINARKGKMTVENVNETIMEIFEVTGFVDILTIV